MKAGVEDGHLRRRRDEMICENQPSKERQTRGEVPGDKRQWRVARRRRLVARQAVCQEDERPRQRAERTRGSGGTTTGVGLRAIENDIASSDVRIASSDVRNRK